MKRPPPKHDAQMDLFMPRFTDIAARDANETMEFPLARPGGDVPNAQEAG